MFNLKTIFAVIALSSGSLVSPATITSPIDIERNPTSSTIKVLLKKTCQTPSSRRCQTSLQRVFASPRISTLWKDLLYTCTTTYQIYGDYTPTMSPNCSEAKVKLEKSEIEGFSDKRLTTIINFLEKV